MVQIRATVKADRDTARILRDMGDAAIDVASDFIHQEAEDILKEAKRITPIDTGKLRESGKLHGPVKTAQTAHVDIRFGGPGAMHAIIIHEKLELRHEPPTQAKFLEQPFKEALRGMTKRFASFVNQRLLRRAA